jgi:hypothetical protein
MSGGKPSSASSSTGKARSRQGSNGLTQVQRADLKAASRQHVAAGLSQLNLDAAGQWLAGDNVFAGGVERRYRRDGDSILPANYDDFTQYLAAASFVHCGDGWAYLGRAVDAILRGDVYVAVHLIYYAELRAALSLLGTEGIFVGDRLSLSIVAANDVRPVSREQTHGAAWQILEAWNGNQQSRDLIEVVLRPAGASLQEWASGVTSSVRATVRELVRFMSLDLRSFSKDRKRRNFVSYQPTRLRVQDQPTAEACRLISTVWAALEPDARGTFPVLDRAIMTEILRLSYISSHQDAVGNVDWGKWTDWLGNMLPTAVVGTAFDQELRALPQRAVNALDFSVAFQQEHEQRDPTKYVEHMLLRAVILLRLCTGSVLRLLDEAGRTVSDVEPWISNLSLARGLWTEADPPDSTLDLWSDVSLASELLVPAAADTSSLLEQLGERVSTLGQAERVCAWSFM